MRILITGANGQVGAALLNSVPQGWDALGLTHAMLDITDFHAADRVIRDFDPDVAVNCAAYTAVDKAEKEPDKAFAVNGDGAGNVARAAFAAGADLIHISTDYVFDGKTKRPYLPDDPVAPVNVYGESKLDGERHVAARHPGAVILRTSWVHAANGANFIHTMLRLMRERDEISVVSDEIGCPTWAGSLAGVIWRFAERRDLAGIWHYTDKGPVSRFDFAKKIQDQSLAQGLLSKRIPIHPIKQKQYPMPAPRPAYSVLDSRGTEQALGFDAPPWTETLSLMLAELAGKSKH